MTTGTNTGLMANLEIQNDLKADLLEQLKREVSPKKFFAKFN